MTYGGAGPILLNAHSAWTIPAPLSMIIYNVCTRQNIYLTKH